MMSYGFLFWLFMIIWALFGGWRGWSVVGPEQRYLLGGHALLFVLFLLLGLKVFGWPIGGG